MLTVTGIVLTTFALVLLVPTLVFFTEIFAGCFFSDRKSPNFSFQKTRRLAVLVPAHNEGAGIKATVEDIKIQLRPGDRLVVVADNCSDDTAAVAALLGAEVTTRDDLTKIGKGYALDWGISYLADAAPDIVVVIDADCRISEGSFEKLCEECSASGSPVQALYLMRAASGSSVNQQVAQFAWRVKNLVRPLGLHKLNLPCQLMGTGMAFPWNLIRSANLSNGFIVEDMKLGLELAAEGHAPRFCPSAVVTSTFPTSEAGSRAQRQRWEQGHLSLSFKIAPSLISKAIQRKDFQLLALALDVLVPPLSLLVTVLFAANLGTALAAMAGASAIPFVLVALSFTLVATSAILAWIKHGRADLTVLDFFLIIPYLARKLSLYLALAAGRKVSRWIRADRG